MKHPTTPYHLYAPRLAADLQVDSLGDLAAADLPAEIAGQPATYFWKDTIHAGHYRHPTRGFSLAVDSSRLRRWADVGCGMLSAGVPIPINCDHSDAARDVVGYVREFKLEGDHLFALCQFIGEDAALTAARNHVSVGIHPDFMDGQGRPWGEAIVHLALTPVPVVPGQRDFIAASGAVGDDLILLALDAQARQVPCTDEQWESLCDLLGDQLTGENCFEQLLSRFNDGEISDESLRAELAAAQKHLLELSAKLPVPLTPEIEDMLAETVTIKLDLAVAAGSLSPDARDRLIDALIRCTQGDTNLLTLSRRPGDKRPLALSVAEILQNNSPIAIGETTGLQTLPRAVPGHEPPDRDQLRDYMTRIASV